MSTQLAAASAMPAHLQDAFGDIGANIRSGVSTPTLGFKNKVWSVRDGDTVKPIMIQSAAGPLPSPIVDVVIVGKNPSYSRIFYVGKYSGDSNDPPTCSSSDGVRPDDGVVAPQSATCAACPQNVKGSKLAQDGVTPIKSCGTVQRLAVVPADDLASKPLLLAFRGNSLFDPDNGDNEKDNKYCYGGYERSLQRDGVNNTAKVVTRIQFDTRTHIEGVKLLFSRRDGWITAEQAPLVVAHVKSPAVAQLVTGRVNGAAPALPAPTVAPALTLAPAIAAVNSMIASIVPTPPATEAPAVAPKPAKKAVLKPVPLPEPVVAAALALTMEQQIEARVRAQVAAEMGKAMAADVVVAEMAISATPVGEAGGDVAPSLDDILADWSAK